MIVAFQTEALRTVCEDEKVAFRRLGQEASVQLRGRLADLRAATSVRDLLAGKPTLSGSTTEFLTIELVPGSSMRWIANDAPPRLNSEGAIDWDAVVRIRLLEIEGL